MGEPTHYLIPAPLLGATLDYLSKRPYIEVADAVSALRRLDPYTSADPAPQPSEPQETTNG